MMDDMGWPARVLVLGVSLAAATYAHPASARWQDRVPKCLPVTDHRSDNSVDVSLLRGHHLRKTRVVFRLAFAKLVVDYAAFDAELAEFLRKNGEPQFPYERQVRERLRAAVATGGEVRADEWIPVDSEYRLRGFFAAMLEQGAFEIRDRKTVGFTVYRIDSASSGGASTVFALPNCRTLVQFSAKR
jgi:hypothetical protein